MKAYEGRPVLLRKIVMSPGAASLFLCADHPATALNSCSPPKRCKRRALTEPY